LQTGYLRVKRLKVGLGQLSSSGQQAIFMIRMVLYHIIDTGSGSGSLMTYYVIKKILSDCQKFFLLFMFQVIFRRGDRM
jgi:hypothetical protein